MSGLGYQRAKNIAQGGAFVAKYGGKACPICAIPICAGDTVRYDNTLLVHAQCEIADCPNADDPVLCKRDESGQFVPECGCSVHDNPAPGGAA